MASSGKKKTTMAKLNRESKLRDRRAIKAARKDARKQAAADGTDTIAEEPTVEDGVRMLTPDEAAHAASSPGS